MAQKVEKPDPTYKYGFWFGAALLYGGVLPLGITAIVSGQAVNEGVLGLVVVLGITGGIVSFFRNA